MKKALAKRSASHGLDRFRDEMTSLMESFFSGGPFAGFGSEQFFPPVDIIDGESELLVKCEVPGLKIEDLTISVSDKTLTIRGEKQEEKVEENGFFRRERSFGSFLRTVSLPCAVEVDSTEATMKDGVLEVTLPKSAQERAKQIKVKAR
ncbi:MAG: Hsp20/alpha crystallin family protein [Planctomycetota bacterium]